MQENEVLNAALFAHKHRLVSIVIQSGERTDQDFIHKIGQLLERIRLMTYGELSVTLSCGVQSPDTYRYWYESGASRYLLRIESGHPGLFEMLHPNDGKHRFRDRLLALEHLKKLGYQTGTGIMIGLPGQTIEMLAMDLAFFRNFDVDMVGMGPYIEHCDAPLPYAAKQSYTLAERLELSLRMIALLRLLMKDINITASTALQAIDESSRLQALRCGANVIMPNITPLQYREDYLLYDNKPGLNIGGEENLQLWNERLDSIGCVPAWNEAGDPTHYQRRMIQGVTG
jgi:biotin synthase